MICILKLLVKIRSYCFLFRELTAVSRLFYRLIFHLEALVTNPPIKDTRSVSFQVAIPIDSVGV